MFFVSVAPVYRIRSKRAAVRAEAAIYDILVKLDLKPHKATPPEVRKYTKDGALYAKQRLEDETVEAYRERCMEAIAADPDGYFQHVEVVRFEHESAAHLDDVRIAARAIRQARKRNEWPRSTGACFDFHSQCAFFESCTGNVEPTAGDALIARKLLPERNLNASAVKTWQRCQRLFRNAHVLGLEPARKGSALVFGDLVHAGLEAWWLSLGAEEPMLRALRALDSAFAPDEYTRARAEAMLAGYHTRWIEWARTLTVLGVERRWEMPLRNAAGRSTGVRLTGRVDVLVRDPEGRVLVVEHKTTSEPADPGEHYRAKLVMDGQASFYLAAEFPADLAQERS